MAYLNPRASLICQFYQLIDCTGTKLLGIVSTVDNKFFGPGPEA
jgi:hypothetical protein